MRNKEKQLLFLLCPALRVVFSNRKLFKEHIQASAADLVDVARKPRRRGRSAAALRSVAGCPPWRTSQTSPPRCSPASTAR